MNFSDFLQSKINQFLLFILEDCMYYRTTDNSRCLWTEFNNASVVVLSNKNKTSYKSCWKSERQFLTTYWLIEMEINNEN